MSTTLTITGITATACSIAFTNLPVGGSVEIQIADNPDFRGFVGSNTFAATPAAIGGLNQRGTYYARGRTVTAGGVYGAWGAVEGFRTADGAAWNTAPQSILVSPTLVVVPEPVLEVGTYLGASLAGYPQSNLFRDDPQLVFIDDQQWNGVQYFVLFMFRTAGQPIDTFALLGTNTPEAGALQIRGTSTMARALANDWDYVSGGVAGAFRASINLPQRPSYHHMTRLAAPLNHKVWGIYVYAGAEGFPLGRAMATHMVAGLGRVSKNMTTDKVESPLDLGSMDRNRAGGPDRTYGHKMRKVDFEISVMSEMQWETQYGDLWRKIALSEPVLVVPNSRTGPFLHDRILYGTIAQARSTNVNSPIFTQSFSCESII